MMTFPGEAVAASRVLVVGDVMLDRYWFGDVDRISPEAPSGWCRQRGTQYCRFGCPG